MTIKLDILCKTKITAKLILNQVSHFKTFEINLIMFPKKFSSGWFKQTFKKLNYSKQNLKLYSICQLFIWYTVQTKTKQ